MPTYTFSEQEAAALRFLCERYLNTMKARTGHTQEYRNIQGALNVMLPDGPQSERDKRAIETLSPADRREAAFRARKSDR